MPSPSQCDVVVIDDNEDIRDALLLTLERLGLSASSAVGADQGIELVRRLHPGVVLVDLNMPGKSGREVLRAIRTDANLADVRTVLMSAESEELTGAAGEELAKPFSVAQLAAVLGARRMKAGGRVGLPAV